MNIKLNANFALNTDEQQQISLLNNKDKKEMLKNLLIEAIEKSSVEFMFDKYNYRGLLGIYRDSDNV